MTRYVPALGWLAATAAATAISWTGVSLVTEGVTGTHLPAAPRPPRDRDAVQLVTVTSTSTTSTTTIARVTSTTVVAARPQPSPSPSTTLTTAPPPPPTASTTQRPAPQVHVITAEGGHATVTCDTDVITLQSVTSNDGYRYVVLADGPDRVDIRFETSDSAEILSATCDHGAVRTSHRAAQPPPPPPTNQPRDRQRPSGG